MIYLFISEIGFFGVLLFVLGLAYFVFWVYTLVDIVNSKFKDPSIKVIWIIVILFAQLIGPIIYWLISKNQKI